MFRLTINQLEKSICKVNLYIIKNKVDLFRNNNACTYVNTNI